MLPTWTQKAVFAAFLAVMFLLPFELPVTSGSLSCS